MLCQHYAASTVVILKLSANFAEGTTNDTVRLTGGDSCRQMRGDKEHPDSGVTNNGSECLFFRA